MIAWIAAVARAGPVLIEPDPADALERCVAAAEAELDPGVDPGARSFVAQPPAGKAQRVAVVVGVPCHRSPSVPSLQYATRDAALVAETLGRAGYEVTPLLTVVDRADLFAALDDAEARLAPDGTLAVYFSGHGLLREEGGSLRRYLVLSDTELGTVGTTGVAVRDLDARIARIPAATRVVIQDTCFAERGGGKSAAPVTAADGHPKGLAPIEPALRPAPGDVHLYASRFYEQAYESVELRGSVYTSHLLEALGSSAADLDGDGCVGLIEAHDWARAHTVSERSGFQVPVLSGVRAPNLALGCSPGAPQHAVIERPTDERLSLSLSARGRAYGPGPVPSGRYMLQVSTLEARDGELVPRRLLSGPVRVDRGDWLDARTELDRRAPSITVLASGAFVGSGALPRGLFGLELGYAARDRGWGRPVVAGIGRFGPGPGPDDAVGKRSFDGLLAVGWSVRIGGIGGIGGMGGIGAADRVSLAVGPRFGVGAIGRTAFPRDADSGTAVGTAVGVQAQPSLAVDLAWGAFAARLDAGFRWVPLARDGAVHPEVAPMFGAGLGARL